MVTGVPPISGNRSRGVVRGIRIQKADVWGEPDTQDEDIEDSFPPPLHPGNQVSKGEAPFRSPFLCSQRDGESTEAILWAHNTVTEYS